MLNPDARSLVTALLTPPPGMVLDEAVATTYTLDPVTVLTMPLHLAWMANGDDAQFVGDGIQILEALRRVGEKLTVYADRGRMQVPHQPHPLYSLLESMIVEVRAPHGGAFHPKIWVLRFVTPGNELSPYLRLAVLSRNLTTDRSWDLVLQLDGQPGGRIIGANRQIGEFIRDLPTFAVGSVAPMRVAAAARLGEELLRTDWEVPAGWSEVGFHVLGRNKRMWMPPPSKQLAVISPFLSAGALDALCKTTERPMALVSRPDQMATLPPEVRERFGRRLVLDEAAETEDGEDSSERDTLGLHAKALILNCGRDTRLFVGSVNASSAALLQGKNLEVWAELVGRRSQIGDIEALMDKETGLGGVLVDFDPTTPDSQPDRASLEAEQALDFAHASIVDGNLSITCSAREGNWQLSLLVAAPVPLGEVQVLVWPLSVRAEQAAIANGMTIGCAIDLGLFAAADVTGMLAFSLRIGDFERRFALNLTLENPPPDRDAALTRRVIQNRDGFMRYLLLLLGEFGGIEASSGKAAGSKATWQLSGNSPVALLEEMVRTYVRDPERLVQVRQLVERLQPLDGEEPVVPPEFMAVWEVFLEVMEVES